jgi:hypothetical protein
VVATPIQQLLRALHRNGALRRNRCGKLQPFLHSFILAPIDAAYQTNTQRLISAERPRAETYVFDPGEGADDLGEPRERADIRSNAIVNLFDSESRIAGAKADISCGANIDGKADGVPMEDDDDRCGFR